MSEEKTFFQVVCDGIKYSIKIAFYFILGFGLFALFVFGFAFIFPVLGIIGCIAWPILWFTTAYVLDEWEF